VITGLGHPAFAVRNVDETIGFYGRLGIEEAFRPSLLPACQIDAEDYHDPAGDLIDPQRLAEEHDA
jgi:catechol 2,3-dioxygenase-like lactoylglutathione lyase family enzyme